MDVDFNHVEIDESRHRGFAYHWLWNYPESTPFTGEYAESGFGRQIEFHNRCSEQFIVAACRYWIDAFGIDGFQLVFTRGYGIDAVSQFTQPVVWAQTADDPDKMGRLLACGDLPSWGMIVVDHR